MNHRSLVINLRRSNAKTGSAVVYTSYGNTNYIVITSRPAARNRIVYQPETNNIIAVWRIKLKP